MTSIGRRRRTRWSPWRRPRTAGHADHDGQPRRPDAAGLRRSLGRACRGDQDAVDRPRRLVVPAQPLLVVAEVVEKPGNLGAILRSADGAGADALIAADPRTDVFNPNAIRASLGTIFALPIAVASTAATIDWLGAHGIAIVIARVDGSVPYDPRICAVRSRSCWAARPTAWPTPGRAAASRRPAADARHCRQPQRVGRRGDPAVRGAPATTVAA